MSSALKRRHNNIVRRVLKNGLLTSDASYSDCTICEEWLSSDNFEEWALTKKGHDIEGWHLDKDILSKGNRCYSPDFCCFVPPEINMLFVSRRSKRGEYPLGVYKHSISKKYAARCSNRGKKVHIGLYSNPTDAFKAYKAYKEDLIKKVAFEFKDQIDSDVYDALVAYTVEIDD